MLDLCKSSSLRIANGRLGSDNSVGTYTFASRTGCSVIDYVILSQRDFSCINDFQVNSFNEWSDHAPLSFRISCNIVLLMNDSPQYSNRIKWNDSLRDDFRRSLIARLTDLNTIVNQIDVSDRNPINSGIENFSKLLNDVAYPLFSKKLCINPPNLSSLYNKRLMRSVIRPSNCTAMRCKLLTGANHENRIIMCNLKLIYKRLIKRKKRLSENNKIREIERLRHAKPKDFGKLFTKKRNTNNNISLEDIFNYFLHYNKT